jgi:hypothetical protein
MGNNNMYCIAKFNEFKTQLIKSLKLANVNVNDSQIEIISNEYPHQAPTLPKDKMAVYAFFYKDKCLKIGKVGQNSNARYNSQHYNPQSSKSNLAKSIISDKSFPIKGIKIENIGTWIRENTQRVNIIIDNKIGVLALNFIEAFSILYFNPKYEGFKSQRI